MILQRWFPPAKIPLKASPIDEKIQEVLWTMFLHHFETGTKNPTTLIFLHGGSLGGWMWRPHVDHYST